MSLTKMFKTNADAEVKGAPFQLPPNEDGTVPTFYIARLGVTNQRYQKTVEEVMKPYRNEVRLGVLSEEKAGELNRLIFVRSLLTGWNHILLSDITGKAEDKGVKAQFTEENALKLLAELPELFNLLLQFAGNMQNFLEANREEDAKN